MSLMVSCPQYGQVVFTESYYIHPSNNKNTYDQKRDFIELDDFQSNDDEDNVSTNLFTLNIEADANHASDDEVDLLRRYTTRRMSIPGWSSATATESLDDHMKNKEKDVFDGTSSPFTLSSWSPVSKLQLETFQSSFQQQSSQSPIVIKKVTQQCVDSTVVAAQVVASPMRKAFDTALAATKIQKKPTRNATSLKNHHLFSSSNNVSINQQKFDRYEEESYENEYEEDEEEEKQRINGFQSRASLVKKKSPIVKRDSSFSGTTTSWLHQATVKVGEKWNMHSASSRLTSFSRITQLITSATTGISGIRNTPTTTLAKTATPHTSHHHTTAPMSSVDIAKRILNKSISSNNFNGSKKKPTKSSLYGVTTVASDEEEAEYEKEQYDQFLYDNRSNNNININENYHHTYDNAPSSGGIQAANKSNNCCDEKSLNTSASTPSSIRTSSSATLSSNGTDNEKDVLFDFLLLYRSKSISE